MIVELGHFALVLALAVALVQMVLPAWGAHTGDARLMHVAEPAALAQLALLACRLRARSRTPTSRPTSRSRTCGPTRIRPSR